MVSDKRSIAVICNYKLKSDRIGGMDRFFLLYNEQLVKKGFRAVWFFSEGEKFELYKDLELVFTDGNAENFVVENFKTYGPFEVVVTHFLALCTSFYKTLKDKGVEHIIAVDHNPRPLQGFSVSKRLKNMMKGYFYSGYIDTFVGVSQYTVHAIIHDYGTRLRKKTRLIYNGIDTSVFKKRTTRNFNSKFIVASHLRPSKGIQDLIEAVHQLPEREKKDLQIHIFGEGPMEGYIREKIKEFKLQNVFTLFGSSSDLPNILQEYSYLIQPTHMECFSLSILESLAANVPVITTPVGGNPEIIEEGVNGFLVEPGDVLGLGEMISSIISGKKMISAVSVNTKIEEQFNIRKMVSDHISIIPGSL